MRKLLFIFTAAVVAVPCVLAADAKASFEFYKKQALSLPADSGREERAFAKTLADGLGTWALQNASNPTVSDALLLQARLYLRADEPAQAVVVLFQLRNMFPAVSASVLNPLMAQAVLAVDADQRDKATALFTQPLPAEAKTPQAREMQALQALSKLSGKTFYAPAAQAFEQFFVCNPDFAQNDKVELWYGDLHRGNGNYLAAISQYQKTEALYPNTPYRAASLRLIGDIYADNLKDTARATAAYTHVLRDFPASSETGVVYKHMAILDENNKQYDTALINYNKAIELLGNTPAAYEAYRGKADVYVKTKAYMDAYNTLHQTADIFRAHETQAADALIAAATVAQKRLRDQSKYIQSLEKALLISPQGPQAPQLMYDLAYAYERQGRTQQAVDAYKKLIIQYPTNKRASRAQGRLNKLTK